MQNNFLALVVFILFLSSCSKEHLNLPLASPIPPRVTTTPPPATPSEPASCAIQFGPQQTLTEVAVAAYEMQERCGFTRDEILKSASLAAGARVVP